METNNFSIKIIECPRDAMQGIFEFIPTEKKISYLNILLKVGFDVLDFGSFVSPKAIPQMRDTAEVLVNLDLKDVRTKLLAIIANVRGAADALTHSEIDYLGFPFSISETFQQRNANQSITQAFETVKEIQNLCIQKNKQLVVYLSMAFGNPYGDNWDKEIVREWAEKMAAIEVKIISLADTVGTASGSDVRSLFETLIPSYKNVEFGAHLHSHPASWKVKVEAAWEGGCRRFDGALKGFGGCPFAKDELVGNIATENLIGFLEEKNRLRIDKDFLRLALAEANEIFVH